MLAISGEVEGKGVWFAVIGGLYIWERARVYHHQPPHYVSAYS